MQHAVSGGVVLDATTASVPFGEEHVNNVHHLSTMSLQDNDMPSMKKQHSQSVPASLNALDNSTAAGMKRVESWSVMEEGGVVVDATPTQDDSLDDVLGGPPAAKAAASPPKPGINVAGRRARMPSGPGDEYAFLG